MGNNAVDQPCGVNSECIIQLPFIVDDKSYHIEHICYREDVTRLQELWPTIP